MGIYHRESQPSRSYITRPNEEKKRMEGFEIIKEYNDYYLCGKFVNGKLLYRETFSKFDIDGIKNNPKRSHMPYWTKKFLLS